MTQYDFANPVDRIWRDIIRMQAFDYSLETDEALTILDQEPGFECATKKWTFNRLSDGRLDLIETARETI